MSSKNHWETVYSTKQPNEVSWTQEVPKTSLEFLHSFNIDKNASIIDIGGGDSRFVDYLLQEGYTNVTVLDISEAALQKTKDRLGDRASQVNWVVSDVLTFTPDRNFDVWHDRATFHFLTTPTQISSYLSLARTAISKYFIIGTFSTHGPKKCSGLEIKQYSEIQLQEQLKQGFEKIRCITEDHVTPFKTTQNFLFCSFKKV
jgi:cyclopropane fatty-acyl-phospholipid synthase-like methyltransferase